MKKIKFQHVHIAILTTLFVGCFIAMILSVTSFKEMMNAQKNVSSFPTSIPVLKQDKQAYTQANYQELLNLFNKNFSNPNISIEIKDTGLIVSASSIESELEVRQATLALLAFDKNLNVFSMCGKINTGCTGKPLEVVLVGEKLNIRIENPTI